LIETLKQVVVAPEDAVQRGPNGLYTFVVGDNNKIEMRDVKIGQEGNGQSVILQGLSPGEKVVIAGQYRLRQGVLVQTTDTSSSATPERATPSAAPKAP
jgi:membrane fusion protein, multidrug efflux system